MSNRWRARAGGRIFQGSDLRLARAAAALARTVVGSGSSDMTSNQPSSRSRAVRRRLFNVAIEKDRRRYRQLPRQGVHGIEREVPLAALDACQIARCHLELVGQLFLRESASPTQCAQLRTERRFESCRGHSSTFFYGSDDYQVLISSSRFAVASSLGGRVAAL